MNIRPLSPLLLLLAVAGCDKPVDDEPVETTDVDPAQAPPGALVQTRELPR